MPLDSAVRTEDSEETSNFLITCKNNWVELLWCFICNLGYYIFGSMFLPLLVLCSVLCYTCKIVNQFWNPHASIYKAWALAFCVGKQWNFIFHWNEICIQWIRCIKWEKTSVCIWQRVNDNLRFLIWLILCLRFFTICLHTLILLGWGFHFFLSSTVEIREPLWNLNVWQTWVYIYLMIYENKFHQLLLFFCLQTRKINQLKLMHGVNLHWKMSEPYIYADIPVGRTFYGTMYKLFNWEYILVP